MSPFQQLGCPSPSCTSLSNSSILVSWSFLYTLLANLWPRLCSCLVTPLLSPLHNLLTWPSSVCSCTCWILPDVHASGHAFPFIYNKLSPTISRRAYVLSFFISFFSFNSNLRLSYQRFRVRIHSVIERAE